MGGDSAVLSTQRGKSTNPSRKKKVSGCPLHHDECPCVDVLEPGIGCPAFFGPAEVQRTMTQRRGGGTQKAMSRL